MNKNQINIYRFTLPDSIGQGLTGLSPMVTITKDGATTFNATTNSASEVNSTDAPGLYEIQFTASECSCDLLTIRVTLATGQAPAILDIVEMQGANGATPAEIWGYTGEKFVDNTIPTVNDIWGRQAEDTTSRTITNIQTELTTYGTAKTADIIDQTTVLMTVLQEIIGGLFNWSLSDDTLTIYNDIGVASKTYTITRDSKGAIISVTPNSGESDSSSSGNNE